MLFIFSRAFRWLRFLHQWPDVFGYKKVVFSFWCRQSVFSYTIPTSNSAAWYIKAICAIRSARWCLGSRVVGPNNAGPIDRNTAEMAQKAFPHNAAHSRVQMCSKNTFVVHFSKKLAKLIKLIQAGLCNDSSCSKAREIWVILICENGFWRAFLIFFSTI